MRDSTGPITFSTGSILFLLCTFLFAPQRTHAVFSAADLMCIPVQPVCGCMQIMGPKGCKPGPNMFMCPCFDITSGFKTTGICMAMMKCLAQDVGGMPPMLPMIPMPMPMPDMPQDPCMAKTAKKSDSASSTGKNSNPCDYGNFDPGTNFFDPSLYFNTGPGAGDLFNSLNTLPSPVSNFLTNATATKPSAPGAPAPLVPTTTAVLSGSVRIGNAGATIVANVRQGLTEVAGFFGGNASNVQMSISVAGRMCASRPWAGGGLLSSIMPDAFFDAICSKAGYQVGIIAPQLAPNILFKAVAKPATTTNPVPLNLGAVSVNIWAEPASVRLGTRTFIFWEARGVVACSTQGPNFSSSLLSSGASTVPISGPTTFTIECTAPNGTKSSDSVTVNVAI